MRQSEQRTKVLALLRAAPRGMTVGTIKFAAELPSRAAADKLLRRMARKGEIRR